MPLKTPTQYLRKAFKKKSSRNSDSGKDNGRSESPSSNQDTECSVTSVGETADGLGANSAHSRSSHGSHCSRGSRRSHGSHNKGTPGYTPNYLGSSDSTDYGYGDSAAPSATSGGYTPGYFGTADNTNYGYGDDEVPPAPPQVLDSPDMLTASMRSDDEINPRRARPGRRSSMKGSSGPGRRSSIGYRGETSVNVPGQRAPVRRRTSIGFEEKVKVKSVAPVSQLTENPEALWFQDDEYDRMKQKSFEIVDRVELGMTGGKKYCTRGLEKLMQKNQEETMGRKYDAWDAVLNEQYVQREQGSFNDTDMADAYKFKTMNSQRDANVRAQQDEEEVEKYLRTTRRMMRRMSM